MSGGVGRGSPPEKVASRTRKERAAGSARHLYRKSREEAVLTPPPALRWPPRPEGSLLPPSLVPAGVLNPLENLCLLGPFPVQPGLSRAPEA